MLALLAHGKGQRQRLGEGRVQLSVVARLANEVAADAAEIGPDRSQRPVGALELVGVCVTLMDDQRALMLRTCRIASRMKRPSGALSR
jgi:hypothetical protein